MYDSPLVDSYIYDDDAVNSGTIFESLESIFLQIRNGEYYWLKCNLILLYTYAVSNNSLCYNDIMNIHIITT